MTDAQEPTESMGQNDIAIVGMAAHLPGAGSTTEYWNNLRNGIESIRRFTEEELIERGESRARIRHPNYVPAGGVLDRFDHFDAEFFGLSPKEAAIMDPQHRQFLEVAWEALEDAGHTPDQFAGPIAVYAGCGMGSYFYFNVCTNADLVASTGLFLLRHTGNDKDFLATRVSHMFDLRGPSVNVQTACSTSLVAVHQACQSLLLGESDMAIAGGVTIELPHEVGYIYQEGEVLSPDGHCHAFDHRAQGTVFGSGAGAVVLRRLEDAVRDGDHIWAVIKGTAVNNDGAAKAGYLAPSVDGQARAIAEAHTISGITADTIDYIECHGTGTFLGDPIEIAALTQAFGAQETGYCRIGSVKTNIGHLDTAAGVASLIKVALALKNRELPPSLNYESPNPSIDFANSPFIVNDALTPWMSRRGPRRAGVNSLGVGGTNAHVIVEEAPAAPAPEASDWPFHLLVLSGRTRGAVDGNARALAAHLRAHPEQALADIAFTLKEGRRPFEHRRVVVASSHEEAASLLEANDTRRVFTHQCKQDNPEVVFMFPGGGTHYVGMARDLYATEPVFKDWMDRGLEIFRKRANFDLKDIWLPEPQDLESATQSIIRPSVQLPLIMIVEYALAQLWMSWGVSPSALVGHSLGEYTAACLAGVMSFEDCVGLVQLRAQLIDTVAPGGMLSVQMAVEAVKPILPAELDIACVNAPELCVVSGPPEALDAFEAQLKPLEVEAQRLNVDVAGHSRMFDPILGKFEAYLRSIELNAPQVPVISNRDGAQLSAETARDPLYWVGHLRNTVNFAHCIATLAATPNRVFLEVGPGKALGSLAQANGVPSQQVINALRHPDHEVADDVWFIGSLGRLWACGVAVDWAPIWEGARRVRVPLPTYAFQRSQYFIAPGVPQASVESTRPVRNEDVSEWGYEARFRPRPSECEIDVAEELGTLPKQHWLVFADEAEVSARLIERLRGAGHRVTTVRAGDLFARIREDEYVLSPERGREGYDALLRDMVAAGNTPQAIVHSWLLTRDERFRPGSSFFHRNLEQGFFSLMFLSQAIAEEDLPTPLHVTVLSSGAVRVRNEALPYPEKAAAAGPVRVVPRELPGVSYAWLDVDLPPQPKGLRLRVDSGATTALVDQILEELLAPASNRQAALRNNRRYQLDYTQRPLPPCTDLAMFSKGAVCFITGGLGGIGLTVAERLAREKQARLVLLTRTALPPADTWDNVLETSPPNSGTARRILAIRNLETLGSEVLVVNADVCNVREMTAAVGQARARFGRIHAVIHSAGAIDDGPLLAKTSGAVEEVLAPKIHGLQILSDLFPDGSIDWLVLFSSTSTVTAPAGQVDYVAANEYLNAFARHRAGGQTQVVAINWGVWDQVGMAAEAMAERLGEKAPAPRHKTAQPLLDEATFDQNGHRLFTTTYSCRERWILDEHRTGDGKAIMPGTGYLELAAEALRGNGELGTFSIQDLFFFRPLEVRDDVPREARVRLTRTSEGYNFEVRSEQSVDGRRGFVVNAQATLRVRKLETPTPIEPHVIAERCPNHREQNPNGWVSPQEAHLNFGARWRVVQSVAFGDGEGIAHLRLPSGFATDLDAGYHLHPALMDLATGWAMKLIRGYVPTRLWVPVSYRKVKVYRPLPAEIWSWVRNAQDNHADAPVASFNVTLCDSEGRVCVEVEDFSIHRLDDTEFSGAGPVNPREVEFDPRTSSGEAAKLSPGEELLQYNISQGIRPSEGADAFGRALAAGLPQVIISSMDLKALIAQTEASTASESGDGQKFQRPDLDSAYVEPRNEIERTLVGFWEDLLGVSQVGVEDSFFDLGGHSLIAVRLFAMIKKAYRVEFPISALFEAPTIVLCADMIRDQIGDTQEESATQSEEGPRPAPKSTRRRFTHLVAMHDGEGGEKTPFFLVAGMFGNVLNLRHLARLLGNDRPFYGLQARGLYGDQAPHETFEEAAADQIEEIRQVRPHGPYLLGGFSGGGLTAYEIAQQLKAQGEEVPLLVMLDTMLPVGPPLTTTDRALIKLAEAREGGLEFVADWAKRRIEWELRSRRGGDEPELTSHQLHNADIEAAFRRALLRYTVKPWDGPIALYRPPLNKVFQVSKGQWVNHERAYIFEDNGWRQFVRQLEVVEVPGNHDSMVLEPNVRVLASLMKDRIDGADREEGGS